MSSLTDIAYLRQLLQRHGFHFSHKLGQNFLINPSVCPRMAESCGASSEVGVLEIGPGVGVLTRELSAQGGKVLAVELDERLRPVLAETLADCSNVEVVWGDAMKLDLAALLREHFGDMPVAVCANLPYYITSPLLMMLLESQLSVVNITVMVQREAAVRLCAPPGTRAGGAISLAVAYYAQARRLFDVGAGSFLPQPKVDSSVIQLVPYEESPVSVTDEKMLFRVIRAAFGQRRKTLANALTGGGFDKSALMRALETADVPSTARAETLTLEDFARVAEQLTNTNPL